LQKFNSKIEKFKQLLVDKNIVERIWNRDFTVWKTDPEEISNRLGWLDTPTAMSGKIEQLNEFVQEVRDAGFTSALLLGMGGSSLAPEVFRKTFGVKDGFLDLHVLDSTHPETVKEMSEKCDPLKTLYIVSTKSGGTVETLSFMKYFYNTLMKLTGEKHAGSNFVAITDPGSDLEKIAKELNFRKIFLNDPDIGGRYSALSYFGLVPAALLGIDVRLLLEKATEGVHRNLAFSTSEGMGEAAQLGITMGLLAEKGIDKLTFILSPRIKHFGIWVEQLIAESTGKEGKGILPVDGEAVLDAKDYAADRLFIYLKMADDQLYEVEISKLISAGFPVIRMEFQDIYDLGAQFFIWELATAVSGWILKINPFDQPNVESAKVLAKKLVESYRKEGKLPENPSVLTENSISVYGDVFGNSIKEVLQKFLKTTKDKGEIDSPRGYICIQSYLPPNTGLDEILFQIRTSLQKKYHMAVTVGYGPRFLHSTGQLHKGDAGNGLFIQFSGDIRNNIDIPDKPRNESSSISFGVLVKAQYLGDFEALKNAGRKVLRLNLGKDVKGNLKRISSLI
jgi:glucose-6-phosphate isomerase